MRTGHPTPAVGLSRIEIGDAAPGAVDRNVDGIRIARDVGIDGVVRRHIYLHAVEVVHIAPGSIAIGNPDAIVLVHGNRLER